MGEKTKTIHDSLKEYGRGIIGGLLFSLPMLYTMELWWAGFLSKPLRLLAYVIVGILILMLYNHFVGLHKNHNLLEEFLESMEELGLGLVVTAIILWLTGRILPEMSLNEISGKIIIEAVTVAIGISVGKAQLGQESDDSEENCSVKNNNPKKENQLFRAISIAFCGAILIASNVAPTEEVVVIALEASALKILLILLLSIAITGSVLYHLNFKGAKQLVKHTGSNWDIIAGTIIMYSVALIASGFMLWFFGRFDNLSLSGIISEIIVLGFPAALGASAGRLLIQS